ncbi:MAG: T9SS type A sorting domain-containing protein [Chitinophagales bacterium]|nr:T9SS type A sorting domain-containing protein [Chitinophagales bacterium]
MVKKTIIFACVLAMSMFICLNDAFTHSTAIPAGYTGAPNEGTCANVGCHAGNPISNSPFMGINLVNIYAPVGGTLPNPLLYDTSTTYNMYVNISASSAKRSFQITAVDGNGNGVGTFILSSTSTTAITNGSNGKQYLSPDTASSASAWAFRWKSPSTFVGPITFFAAAVASNNDGTVQNDIVYLDSLIFPGQGQPPAGLDADFSFNPSTACTGQSITFTNTSTGGASTFSWDFGSGASTPTANTVGPHSVSYSTTGTKTVTLVVGNGTSTDTVRKTVTITSGVSVNAGADQTICPGESVTLSATGADDYTWNNGAGGGPTVTVSPAQTTAYVVTGITGSCSGTDTVIVTVNPAPVANAGADQSACEGQQVSFTGSGGVSYEWDLLGQFIPQQTIGGPAPPQGLYPLILEVTDANGCTDLDTAFLTVNATPVVNISDQTVCGVSSVTLDAGNNGATYQWSTTQTSQTIVVDTDGTYSVTVTSNGCTATDEATVAFVTNLPISVPDVTICDGDTAFLDAGYPNAVYQWSNNDTSRVTAVTTGGGYSVTVNDGVCVGADTAFVTITPLPAVDAGPDASICQGDIVDIGAAVSSSASFLWSPAVNIVDPTAPFTQAFPTSTTLYVLTAIENGCVATDTVLIEVNNAPVVSFTGLGGPYCEDDNNVYQLFGNPSGGFFSGPGVGSPVVRSGPRGGPIPTTDTFVPADAGDGTHLITYSYTDPFTGCTAVDSQFVTVNPTPVPSILNLPNTVCISEPAFALTVDPVGGILSGNGIDNGNFDPALAGAGVFTITYEYTDAAGCFGSYTQQVEVVEVVLDAAVNGSNFCSSDATSYDLIGNPSGGVFSGPGVSGSVFVPANAGAGFHEIRYDYFDAASGCTFFDTIMIPVSGILIDVADTTICEGNSVVLTATGGQSYLWNTSETTASITVSPTDTTQYTVTGLDLNGCSATATATVNVEPTPVVSFSGLAASYCSNESPATLVGNPVGGIFSGTGISNDQFVPSAGIVGGPYDIKYVYISPNGCGDSLTQQTQVFLAPQATISALDSEYCLSDLPVTLNGSPAGGTYTGPGLSNGTFVPYYAGVGTHTISYRVPQPGGCDASVDVNLVVYALPVISFNPIDPIYCINEDVVQLVATPVGGTFSGPGVIIEFFTPEIAGLGGPYVIDYTYTDSNGCTNSAYQLTEVFSVPSLSLVDVSSSYCENQALVTLVGQPFGGTFSGPGITDNEFNAAQAGVGSHQWVFSYTGTNGCTDTIVKPIVVKAAPSISINNLDSVYCLNANLIQIDATPPGGTFTGLGIVGNVFNPLLAGTGGPYTITYSYTDLNGCSDTTSQTVSIQPTANLVIQGLDETYCVGQDVDVQLVGSPAGGMFTGAGVIASADDTIFNPSEAGVGRHFIFYDYMNPIGCRSYQLFVVDVNDCVGITQEELIPVLNVYPNPTGGFVNLEFENTSTEGASVMVYNLQGQIVRNEYVDFAKNGNALQLDLSNQAPGIYLVKSVFGTVSKTIRIVKY